MKKSSPTDQSVSKRTAKKVSQVVAEKKTIIEKSPPVKNLRSNSPVKKLESKLPVKVLENKSPVKILENKSPVKKLEDKSTVKTSISKTTDTAKNVTNTSMNKSRRKKQPTKLFRIKTCHVNRTFTMKMNMYREIRKLQQGLKHLIPRAPFLRFVKEILFRYSNSNMRIQHLALVALQEAAEMFMTQFFEESYLTTLHAKRVTLYPEDMRLVRRLRGCSDICN